MADEAATIRSSSSPRLLTTSANATPPPPPEEIYVVQPGDTLGGIAKEVYGDFRLWPVIFEANRDKLSDPGLIRVGMELLIPPRS